MEEIKYPARINKYLALKKICSRREADRLIADGKIFINGKKAGLGDKIKEGDLVDMKDDLKKDHAYFALNKPRGIITHSPQGSEISIDEAFKFPIKVFPVGRLDKDSHGLIIMTNDGRITDKLLNPKFDHEKEYAVRVDHEIDEKFLRKMGKGVVLEDGYKTKECEIRRVSTNTFSIILTEGKKRQIRRMCSALGFSVTDLKRKRILNVELGGLREGQFRKIKGRELDEFLSKMGF